MGKRKSDRSHNRNKDSGLSEKPPFPEDDRTGDMERWKDVGIKDSVVIKKTNDLKGGEVYETLTRGQRRFEEAELKQKICDEKTAQHVWSLRAASSGYEAAVGGAAESVGNYQKYRVINNK